MGDNPPDGAYIAYYEPHRRLIGKLTLQVLDASGKVVDTLPATGEERLREHTDQLYGAINSWEGQPAAYQLTRIGVLEGQLSDIGQRFEALAGGELAPVNAALSARKLAPITLPVAGATTTAEAGGDAPLKALAGWGLSMRPRAADKATAQERD